jgi:hypothetical protein
VESFWSPPPEPPAYIRTELSQGPQTAMNSFWTISLLVNTALTFKVDRMVNMNIRKYKKP